MENYIGVDGCRFGWVAVTESEGRLESRLFLKMRALLDEYPSAGVVLVDIPIGLPSKDCPSRPCDQMARRLLRAPRASSVFSPPCRDASRAGDVAGARRLNIAELGRSLSEQAWGICGKIAEVDALLLADASARSRLREVHPELCFYGLNGGKPMQHAKRNALGVAERLAVLARFEPRAEKFLDAALLSHPRRVDVKEDDLLDALVAYVTARVGKGKMRRLCGHPEQDEQGLPMEMVYLG